MDENERRLSTTTQRAGQMDYSSFFLSWFISLFVVVVVMISLTDSERVAMVAFS